MGLAMSPPYVQQIFPVRDRLGQAGWKKVSIVGLFFHKDGKEFMNILWKDVINVGYYKKKLHVRYHPKGSSDGVEHMLYLYCSEPSAKLAWRVCVEQHAFSDLWGQPHLSKTLSIHITLSSITLSCDFQVAGPCTKSLEMNTNSQKLQSLPALHPVQITNEELRPNGLGPIRLPPVATLPPISKSESNMLEESKFYMTVETTKSEPDLTRVVEFSTYHWEAKV